MFTTLKVSDSATGLETLRVRNQISQRRRAPLVQNACINCRIKKLRCSGEEKGCRRCLSKAIDCVYQPSNGKARATDAKSHAVRTTSNQTSNESSNEHADISEDYTLANTDQADSIIFSDIKDFDFSLFTESEFIDPSTDGLGSSFHIHGTYSRSVLIDKEWPATKSTRTQYVPANSKEGEDTLSPRVQSPPSDSNVPEYVLSRVLPVSASMPTATTMRADASDLSNDSSSSQLTRSSISRNSSISSTNGVHRFLESNGDSTGIQQLQSLHPEPSVSEKGHQQQHRGECPCITKVLLAYQDININLDGTAATSRDAGHPFDYHLGASEGSHRPTNQRGSFTDQQQVPVEIALHCIKSSLEICEILMDCQACSARSECIMLSISMCDTMVSRAEELVGAVDHSPFPSMSASTMTHQSGGRNNSMSLSSDSNPSPGSASRAPQGNHYAPSVQSRSGLRIGHWRLDNEDELQVIQSLLTARMTRLDGLTARMKRVAQQNEWPVHDARVSSVRERLATAMFLAKKRSFF